MPEPAPAPDSAARALTPVSAAHDPNRWPATHENARAPAPATHGTTPSASAAAQVAELTAHDPPRALLPGLPQTLDLEPGERLTLSASAPAPIEFHLTHLPSGRPIHHAIGPTLEHTHLAPAAERVRITALAPTDAIGQSGRLMIARASATQAETSAAGDGAAHLTRRHHLLMNLFGVTPSELHPETTLALVRQLDALELTARALAHGPAAPALQDAALTIEHTDGDGHETATYTLTRADATLTLRTAFDHHTGQLDCHLAFAAADGTTLDGRLSHALPPHDGMPQTPTADPVADYLDHPPAADPVPALDDLTALDPDDEEGITAFFTGALAGDFADDDSYSALAGQTLTGFIPIAGQLADARDIAAAATDIAHDTPGAWGRLGINVIAVIPGLDFLKAGRVATREAIREGAEEALDQTSRHSVKKLRRRGLSKAAAARAAKELRVINAGRVELIERLQRYSAEGFFDDETLGVLMKTRNALENGLKPSDLAGALRDVHGIPVPDKLRGRPYDHLQEVSDAIRSVQKSIEQLKRSTRTHPPGGDGFARVSKDRDALEEFIARVNRFLETS